MREPNPRDPATWPPRKLTIQESFIVFHKEHPEVYRLILKYARQAKRRGFDHYSIKTIWELIRWYVDIGPKKYGEFKMNNNFHSRYARLVMHKNPDLAGFFEVRKLHAK